MTSSAAAKGKWAAHKGFAKRANRGSHMPAAHDPQSSFTAARLIRGFLEHLLLLQPYRAGPTTCRYWTRSHELVAVADISAVATIQTGDHDDECALRLDAWLGRR